MADIALTVDGLIYGGWKSVSVRRSIETVAGTFSLSASERWPGQQALKAILPGQKCTVSMATWSSPDTLTTCRRRIPPPATT